MGEFIFVRTEKAFPSLDRAEKFLNEKKKEFVALDGKPKSVLVETPNGAAECICEVGVFELEVED